MKTTIVVLLSAFVLVAGCTIVREQVIYREPATGREEVCLKPPAMALGPADIPERNRYANCKTRLEERGFIRITPEN